MLIRPQHGGTRSAGDLLPAELAGKLDALDVLSRRVLAGKMQGERRSKRRGRSVEFDDYRPYTAGDDLRHIDWNVFARLDRFFLKIFQEEEDLSVHIILDCSASMLAGTPSKIFTGAQLAAALAYVALVNNNRVHVACTGLPAGAAGATPGGLLRLQPMRGRGSVQGVVGALVGAVNAAEGAGARVMDARGFSADLRTLAMTRSGRGVVVIVSDLLLPGGAGQEVGAEAGYVEGLKFFAGSAGYDALVVQILAPGEIDPSKEVVGTSARPALVGDMRLLDAETSRGRDLTITPALLLAYRKAVEGFVESAAEFCTRHGIRHALLTSDADIPGFVLSVLRRRGLVG